ARIRRLAGTRRVGHAGTLDPMATGVLVVGVEKATRLLGHLTLTEKEYQATIRLGQATDTGDAEGAVLTSDTGLTPGTPAQPAARLTRAQVEAAAAALTGEIQQVPPAVSAIKVAGRRAYQLAREGAPPVLPPRPVTVWSFTIQALRPAPGDLLDVDVEVRCSSGTYIRALARDLGAALGTGGHLTALRRTAVGPYDLAQAHTLQELEDQKRQNLDLERTGATAAPQLPAHPAPTLGGAPAPSATATASPAADPAASAAAPVGPAAASVPWITPLAEAAAAAFPRLDLTAEDAHRLAQGARLPLPSDDWPEPGIPVAAFDPDSALVALVTAESGSLRSLAVFSAP
ncbi:MAG TPA: tRNA pseudouridine(55) synthase TruB, partial [Streptosporangiaceae bacterium]|nr:tRNA pseudouridine(55) synthase TruB [Streptosporangiaceae bacterium]